MPCSCGAGHGQGQASSVGWRQGARKGAVGNDYQLLVHVAFSAWAVGTLSQAWEWREERRGRCWGSMEAPCPETGPENEEKQGFQIFPKKRRSQTPVWA